MELNDRIKQARKSSGLTQETLANQIGLTRVYYCRVETGRETPSERTLKDIARITHVNYDWLKDETGEPLPDDVNATALAASAIIENDTPFYSLVVDVIRAYSSLPPADKEAVDRLINGLKNKG